MGRMRKSGSIVVLVAVLSGACGLAPPATPTVQVSAEVLPWGDLSAFRTYRWWQLPLVERSSRVDEEEARIDWHVRQAVDHELATRGYAPDTVRRPDFVVRYTAGFYDAHTSSVSEYLTYRAEGGGQGMGEAFMGYERGMLMIELVDAATAKVAWRGKASAIVQGRAGGKRIAPAVQQMMASVPAAVR